MNANFNWDSSGLDKEFTALANLLTLFNKKAERTSLSHEGDGYISDNESIASDSDISERGEALSHDHGKLKIQFLNCLAELVGNMEDPRPTICTSMTEGGKGVTIWVTKTGGFMEQDHAFLDKLANLLGCFASANGDEEKAEGIWTAILGYYEHHFENMVIPQLKCSLQECKDNIPTRSGHSFSAICQKIETLNKVICENSEPHLRAIGRHNMLMQKGHALREDKSVHELLKGSADADAGTRKLWGVISLLGRLQETHHVFKRLCQTVPVFKAVTIHPIPYEKASERPIEKPLNLEQTLWSLGKHLDPPTIAEITRQKCPISKAQEQFEALQNQVPWVHAETQMVLYFSTHGRSLGDLFPYLGCNQLSCFMCTSFLEHYGDSQIQTRGLNVALLQPWAVPEVTGITPENPRSIPSTLWYLEDYVRTFLKDMLKK